MSKSKNKKNRYKKVDLYQPSFSEVSVRAIHALYREKSMCEEDEFRRTTFRDMVEYLRKMEDPTYQLTHVINI